MTANVVFLRWRANKAPQNLLARFGAAGKIEGKRRNVGEKKAKKEAQGMGEKHPLST